MTWFKVDDTFALHAKVLAAGNSAIGLWVRAGAWSMQQLTDGFVPDGVARTLGSAREASALVTAGLWVKADSGYQFHQWTDVQRTKEQVKADRDAATERQRRAREAAKSRKESQRDKGVSHGPPDQTRPDQTSSSYGTSGEDGKPSGAKRAHQLPGSWQPNDRHQQIAATRSADLNYEVEKFRDWVKSKGETKKDWDATFNNWLRNAKADPRLITSRPTDRRPLPHETHAPPSGLSDAEYDDWERDPVAFMARRASA